jgi:hypothetical protein
MKWILTITLTLLNILLQVEESYAPNVKENIITILSPTPINYNMELENRKYRILQAIIHIERPRTPEQAIAAIKRERAVGVLQIHPIMVATVNQIVGYNKYYLQDRNDSIKSVEMFMIYQQRYNPSWDVKKAALLWNGGSNYMKANKEQKKRLDNYWNKVKKLI